MSALQLSTPPPGVDRGIWLYELCRLLVARVNTIIVSLFADDPACSATTCPEMRASEWQYLCAAHDPPKSCCAIDYCCHTLDWSAIQLTSSKLFPSRLALGTENVSSAHQQRKMTEIFRRVYRIFAHAWFQHRSVFWRVEGRTGLYIFFKTVCDEFRLIPEDSYTVPPEAEAGEEGNDEASQVDGTRILSRDGDVDLTSGNDTQKRHHRPTVERQGSVSTIIHEEVEEDFDDEDHEMEAPNVRGVVLEVPAYDSVVIDRSAETTGTTQAPIPAGEPPSYVLAETEVSVDYGPANDEEAPGMQPRTETTITGNAVPQRVPEETPAVGTRDSSAVERALGAPQAVAAEEEPTAVEA